MQLSEAISLIDHPQLHHKHKSNWADLGCGSGLFTQALSTFLPAGSTIHAVDKKSLQQLPNQFNNVTLHKTQLDFTKAALPFTALDGLLMANSLHYVKEQEAFLHKATTCMKEGSRFVIIEYDTDSANRWVPYPLSYTRLKKLFQQVGYTSIVKISERPSLYGSNNMYATLIEK